MNPFPEGFKPMLADKVDRERINFPVIASPKVDGWRALGAQIKSPEPRIYTRSLEPIPNRRVQRLLADIPVGLDGEIVTFTNGLMDHLNVVGSKLSKALRDDFDFILYAFDRFDTPTAPFVDRLQSLPAFVARTSHVRVLESRFIHNMEELDAYEEAKLAEKWEGIMIRDPKGRYKFGRSSVKQGGLLKVKRFLDSEGTILGVHEGEHNQNEAEKDNFGRTKRSSAKAGMVPNGTLGSFDISWRGVVFNCGNGPGMTQEYRKELWDRRDSLVGRRVTFKYQQVGTKGKPLLPGIIAIREDM